MKKIHLNDKAMYSKAIEPLPSCKHLKSLVKPYVNALKSNPRYAPEEDMLQWLIQTYPNNTKEDLNTVLLKVMALDSSYSTNLRQSQLVMDMANKITQLDFDGRIRNRDLGLVDDMCKLVNVTQGVIIKTKPFSFCTKYCCLHNLFYESPNVDKGEYAIYDSFVAKVLAYYQKVEKFLKEDNEEDKNLIEAWRKAFLKPGVMSEAEALKDSYEKLFYPIITKFKERCCNESSYRELDHFLWRMGQEYFLSYVMAVVGDYVIVKMIDKTQIAIYRLCEKPNGAANELDACAKGNNFVRLPRGETDVDFAFRMLKKYYPCVMRREGRIGRHHYIQVDESKASVKVYNKKYDSAEEKRKKNNRMSEKELNEIKYSICKAVTDSDTFRGYEVDEKKQLDDVCKDIVEKYREKKQGEYRKKQEQE